MASNHGKNSTMATGYANPQCDTYCPIRTIRVLKNRFGSVPA
jgi:hypothetical protein